MNEKINKEEKDEDEEILELVGECKEILKKMNERLEKPIVVTS